MSDYVQDILNILDDIDVSLIHLRDELHRRGDKAIPTQSLKWSEVCELLIKNGVELPVDEMDKLEQIIKKGE